jgi:hypothetical protein
VNRRLFLQALSYLSLVACHPASERKGGAAGAPTREEVDARIDQRIAEQNVDYVTLLEANPNMLRRDPTVAASLRKALRDQPEVRRQYDQFRVAALKRLKTADVEPRAKMAMLDAQLEKVSHAVTTCMDHFIGVHDILKAWGHPDEVALVGLFHAMYGTEYFVLDLFDYRMPSDRLRLKGLVGEKTERWILQYGLMRSREFVASAQSGAPAKRLDFFEKTDVVPEEITPGDFFALAEIQVANAYEPFAQARMKDYLSIVTPYTPLREFLSDGAKAAVDVALRDAPRAPR